MVYMQVLTEFIPAIIKLTMAKKTGVVNVSASTVA